MLSFSTLSCCRSHLRGSRVTPQLGPFLTPTLPNPQGTPQSHPPSGATPQIYSPPIPTTLCPPPPTGAAPDLVPLTTPLPDPLETP